MAPAWLKARQTKYSAFAFLYIAVVVGVLVFVNVFADRYNKSYDSTSNKQFSLSEQTIKIVKGLKTETELTYFGSDFTEARDTLDRYSSLSPKVHARYIDPDRKPQEARAAGYRSDSPVVVDTGSRKEGAKSLTEEEITAALIRATRTGERTVCMLSAAGEHSADEQDGRGYSTLKTLLERENYKVRAETLKSNAVESGKTLTLGQQEPTSNVEIGKDCTVLVIGGPKSDYPVPVVSAIEKYVEGGGRALILLDTTLRLGGSEPPSENEELGKVLAKWGVTADKDLVLDLSGLGQIFNLGPEIPFIISYDSHAITQPLTRIPTAYPLARSLEIKPSDKTTVTKLVDTTDNSVGTDSIGPRGAVDPRKGKKGPLTLAAAGTYNGSTQGRFVVVGTSYAAENSLLGSRQLGNRDLFVNMVNWLSSDEDLISIQPKARDDRPVNLTTQRMQATFWFGVVVLPLLIVGTGFFTWWKRR
ncbi:MAG TPA: GldG family protein [Candidatus Acidoferrum sp.]|nr:GldG family protein [Candidatus Acidoferrum sp.]